MSAFSRARIPDITLIQWTRARDLFERKGERIEPSQLRSAAGMHLDTAYSLILGLFQEQLADLYLLVFHTCEESNVAVRSYMDGFQPVPWLCPVCEEQVTDGAALNYELRAVLRAPVEFVD